MNNIAKMAMIQQMARKEDETRNERTRNEDARVNQGEYYPPRDEDRPESRRRRDSRGRYMEGDTEMRRYMEDDPEMRRRRDSRGRYMEDNPEMRDPYNGDMPESRRERRDDGRYAPRNEERYDRDTSTWDYSPEERRANMYALPQSNLIGFMGRDERRMQQGEHREQEQRMGQSQGIKPFDHEMAKEWTGMMKNADGTTGPHWTREQAKPYMSQIGFKGEELEFWAVMNAMYSDYCAVLKRFGVDRPEVYAALAKAWLEDKDAVEDKAAAYFECIVEHD